MLARTKGKALTVLLIVRIYNIKTIAVSATAIYSPLSVPSFDLQENSTNCIFALFVSTISLFKYACDMKSNASCAVLALILITLTGINDFAIHSSALQSPLHHFHMFQYQS